MLLGGGDGELDVDDLARHTVLSGGYRADSRAVCNLWAVLKAWPSEQRRAVLRFVTSTERAPLLGFQHLHPPFTIHKVHADEAVSPFAWFGGQDVQRLPTAATCYNMLKLPSYRRRDTLRDKLAYAVASGAGFELS